MGLDEAINEIVGGFSSGKIFDSHVVIDELRDNSKYSEVYMHEISEKQDAAKYHGKIAQIIRDSGLVDAVQAENADMMINTKNVHGGITSNHVWRRK